MGCARGSRREVGTSFLTWSVDGMSGMALGLWRARTEEVLLLSSGTRLVGLRWEVSRGLSNPTQLDRKTENLSPSPSFIPEALLQTSSTPSSPFDNSSAG